METIETIIRWHRESFPDATLDGQIAKFEDEKKEFIDSDYRDVSEYADMFIVACGIARFDSVLAIKYFKNIAMAPKLFDESKIPQAIADKMKINRARKWGKKDGKYQHIEG